ncbi:hypothetical protein CY35_06G090100 [Sphagnum magellanicum]|nr:hypothetical protein CY35_06G090100 [Sphagnum magellanicum]
MILPPPPPPNPPLPPPGPPPSSTNPRNPNPSHSLHQEKHTNLETTQTNTSSYGIPSFRWWKERNKSSDLKPPHPQDQIHSIDSDSNTSARDSPLLLAPPRHVSSLVETTTPGANNQRTVGHDQFGDRWSAKKPFFPDKSERTRERTN